MTVRELVNKLAALGSDAMELPVVSIEECWAVTIEEVNIVTTDGEGDVEPDTGNSFFINSGYPNQKVVVVSG